MIGCVIAIIIIAIACFPLNRTKFYKEIIDRESKIKLCPKPIDHIYLYNEINCRYCRVVGGTYKKEFLCKESTHLFVGVLRFQNRLS